MIPKRPLLTPLSRRTLLQSALCGTAAIPLLDAHRAGGQSTSDKPPTRLVVFATPNGTRNTLFWPTQGSSGLTFPQYTQPLSAHQDRLLFLDGIRHCPAVVGDNGFAGGLNGSEHARGIGGLLTARPLGTGSFQSFMATSGWGSGISLDQYLGDILALPTRFKTLELGVHVRDSQVRGRISYRGADQPVPPREDPADVFDALFSGDGESAADPELARLRAERRSVFDLTKREIQRLQARLGAEDRVKLEAHLTSIRDIESRLSEVGGSGASGGVGLEGCTIPSGEFSVNLLDDTTQLETGRLQMDLAAAALACDQTRIITIQWNYAESEHLFPFLGLSRNHHVISHDWQGTAGFEEYGKIHVWFAEQLAYFLTRLESYQEGDGTLLDNTVVFWGSEIGESTQHDLTRMPYVLAGGGGGVLNTGRVLDFKDSPRDNNQLLVSLAHMMGAPQVESFGDASGATGPLPDLLL
jgi:Protein of unknown function (DUF1552)